jgi:uncharacterized membrane protein YdjX (TVP38/TMEM64 family)
MTDDSIAGGGDLTARRLPFSPAARRQLLGLGGLLLLLGLAAVLLSPAALLDVLHRLTHRPLWLGAALVAAYAVRPLLGWPVMPLSAIVGYAYGPVLGVPLALAAAVATCCPTYLAARRWDPSGGPFGWAAGVGRRALDRTGDVRGVASARLLPTPADAVSCAAGLAGTPPRAFLGGTLLGQLPWTVAAVLIGASADRLAAARAVDPWVVVGFAAGGIALLLPILYRSTRRQAGS